MLSKGMKNLDKEFYTKETVGAIKTYLKIINEESEEINGSKPIDNNWYYGIDGENNFQVTIKVNDIERRIIFEEKEWFSNNVNMLGNEKLEKLQSELIAS